MPNETFTFPHIRLEETDSTNRYLNTLCTQRREAVDEFTTVSAAYQTSGKGQRGNSWEADAGRNLLFSTLMRPTFIHAKEQFVISQIVSLSVKDELTQLVDDISIKWPNDIYWRDLKIAGILIENDLNGSYIARSICGVGLNVNQDSFSSDAPNPVSLKQITGKEYDVLELLTAIIRRLERDYNALRTDVGSVYRQELSTRYARSLYRRRGFHPYRDAKGKFMARLLRVEDDGRLLLEDETGRLRAYLFKEVQIVL